MEVVVVGAGAMGCSFGGMLAHAGASVSLVDPWEEHLATIREQGLTLEIGPERLVVKGIEATSDPLSINGTADIVLIFCKAYQTEQAVAGLGPLVGDSTSVVTLQNGIGHDRRLAGLVDPERVVLGATSIGARVLAPGVVETNPLIHDEVPATYVGAAARAETDSSRLVAEALTGAGIATELCADVLPHLWKKLAMANAALVTSIARVPIGGVLDVPVGASILDDLLLEIAAIADRENAAFDVDAARAELGDVWSRSADHVTSMLRDVLMGRQTEVSAMHAEAARVAARIGVDAPLCDALSRLVTLIESTNDRRVDAV